MKGTYALIIELASDERISVGKLGKINFKKGYYLYVGSGQNSLEARIARHLRKRKKKFWHIDYLLASSRSFLAVRHSIRLSSAIHTSFILALHSASR
jgi:Uri superfamily endonuclease